MRKFIYNSIVDKLKEMIDKNSQPVIRHFDIWNNNITYLQDEQPFFMPAVLIEFQPIQWRHQGNGVREAAVTVMLHVLIQRNAPTQNNQKYEDPGLCFFDLLTDINRCLHGHSKTSFNFGHDAVTATQSVTDHDFEEIQHHIEAFTCHVSDASAMPDLETVRAGGIKVVI
ncbi:MAG: hypothetical protein LBM08_03975 [Dysgonamonadaceae bacterium]|jgi:hypothetical protein|nr:hypothetical protein [Dysgonamonadaceae bacterium]